MKVFLTGATGYIGSVIAEKLQDRGHAVLGLARSDEAAGKLRTRGIEVHRGDLADPESLVRGAQQADAVITVAQPITATEQLDMNAMMAMLRMVVQGQTALIESLADTQKILIVTSGTGAYGDTGEQVVDEETPPNVPPEMAGWAQSEQQVIQAAATGVRSMIIRPSIVYGRGGSGVGPVLPLLQIARQTGKARYVGTGQNLLSTVHVDDVGDAYVLALEKAPAGEIFNLVAEPFVSMKAIMEAISHTIGTDGATEALSFEEAQQMLGPMAGYMIGNMRVSGAKAKRVLGWIPQQPNIIKELRYGSYAG